MPPVKYHGPSCFADPPRETRQERAAWRELQRACEANDAAAVAAWCAECACTSLSVQKYHEYVFNVLRKAVALGQHDIVAELLQTQPSFGRIVTMLQNGEMWGREDFKMALLLFRALAQKTDKCCWHCADLHDIVVLKWTSLACQKVSSELCAHLFEHHVHTVRQWENAARAMAHMASTAHAPVLVLTAFRLSGYQPNAVEQLFAYALTSACQANHTGLAAFWLGQGAPVNGVGVSPLTIAANSGHVEVINFLLERGADIAPLDDILDMPVDCGWTRVVLRLLQAGAHVSDDNFILAASRGMCDVVDCMLNRGANVHAGRDSALFEASRSGHTAVVERLLAAGAVVNNVGAVLSPLEIAVVNARHETALALVRAGANVGDVSWILCPRGGLWQVAAVCSRAQYDQLRDNNLCMRLSWCFLHIFVQRRLYRFLWRARARLDRPPTAELCAVDPERPTRGELVAQMRTAGKRFAREYWAEGLPLFFPGLDLGPVPNEFVF